MDVTCEVNEWSAHKVELAENVQNILIVFYKSKHMSRNTMAAKKSSLQKMYKTSSAGSAKLEDTSSKLS